MPKKLLTLSSEGNLVLQDRHGQSPLPVKKKKNYLILFDATGSMQPYRDEVKRSIREIIARLFFVASGFDVCLKIIAYRDEDYPTHKVIEQSPWSGEAQPLCDFITGVCCDGGGDFPESVDLALQSACNEADLSRAILIGDAPPHSDRSGNRAIAELSQRSIPVDTVLVGTDQG